MLDSQYLYEDLRKGTKTILTYPYRTADKVQTSTIGPTLPTPSLLQDLNTLEQSKMVHTNRTEQLQPAFNQSGQQQLFHASAHASKRINHVSFVR